MTPPVPQDQPPYLPPGHWASPFTVLGLTLMTVLFGLLFGGLLTLLSGYLLGFDLDAAMAGITDDNTLRHRNILRGANLISHIFAFSMPPLAVAAWLYRREWSEWLGLSRVPSGAKLAAAVGVMLLSLPLVQLAYWLNKQLPLPELLAGMEERTGGIIQALLVMDSPFELLFNLLVIGVAPAVGEELLFRGVVQQQTSRWLGKPVTAIWLTAILFSLIHLQFAGFLPRLLLGAALGYLFYWTRSLWAPIVGHFAVNGIQVLAQYFAKTDLDAAEQRLDFSTLLLPSFVVLPVLYWLIRVLRKPESAPISEEEVHQTKAPD
ncbi:MAG: CPBP family intramembrane metalloprotease [Saprospiraceae bacterium]|nr:CPBP family intramembrane metalloprotease [Saprospiraceae bacterium]